MRVAKPILLGFFLPCTERYGFIGKIFSIFFVTLYRFNVGQRVLFKGTDFIFDLIFADALDGGDLLVGGEAG